MAATGQAPAAFRDTELLSGAVGDSNLSHTLSAVDEGQPLIYVNQAFLDETGYERDEVTGRNCRFLQGPGTDPAAVAEIREALRHYRPLDIKLLNYRKDGTPFLNRLRLSTVFGQDGRPVAFLGIQSNIDKIVESARLSLERHKMETMGNLFSNISHEIKNALLPVRLMLDNLADASSMSSDQILKCIGIATQNMEIAEDIVTDVLRYSKRNSNEQKEIGASELVSQIARFARNLASSRVALKLAVSGSLQNLHVTVNQTGILQIISNLINNAVDEMDSAGTLNLAADAVSGRDPAKPDSPSRPFLRIGLHDNGPGIDPAIIDNIFQPFYSTRASSSGTGLGLAISRKIATEHGGYLTARNHPVGGAIFELAIPAVPVPA